MTRLLAIIARLWSALRCDHYFVNDGAAPGAEGILVRRRCVRCKRIEYSHHLVRRKL